MSDSKPQHRWVLEFPDGIRLLNRSVRRASSAPPSVIEEAIGIATCRPGPHTKECIFGRTADGRLVVSFISELHRFYGEDLAAAKWLSGAPRGYWRSVEVTTPEAVR
ncbi:hypothetical protein JNN96_32700 [Mycobacterium sp. DSM 3803]|nr:hypothetical protein [Mycobacterium sp. DSM 3803]